MKTPVIACDNAKRLRKAKRSNLFPKRFAFVTGNGGRAFTSRLRP
jgi:hypothetical protein